MGNFQAVDWITINEDGSFAFQIDFTGMGVRGKANRRDFLIEVDVRDHAGNTGTGTTLFQIFRPSGGAGGVRD